jgi:hypothetical protein
VLPIPPATSSRSSDFSALGDLPAEHATKFKPFVNLKTAKELCINIPATIVARADGPERARLAATASGALI